MLRRHIYAKLAVNMLSSLAITVRTYHL